MEFWKIRTLALAEKILRSASFDPRIDSWKQSVCLADLRQLKEGTFQFEDIIEDARSVGRSSHLRTDWWCQLVKILRFYCKESTFWWL